MQDMEKWPDKGHSSGGITGSGQAKTWIVLDSDSTGRQAPFWALPKRKNNPPAAIMLEGPRDVIAFAQLCFHQDPHSSADTTATSTECLSKEPPVLFLADTSSLQKLLSSSLAALLHRFSRSY